MTFKIDGASSRTIAPSAIAGGWRGQIVLPVPSGSTLVCVVQAPSRYALAGQTCHRLQTIRAGLNLRLRIAGVARHGARYGVRIVVPALLRGHVATVIARPLHGRARGTRVRLAQTVTTTARLPAGVRPRLLRVTAAALRYGGRTVKVIAGTWQRR